jgi:chromosome partitioning protein
MRPSIVPWFSSEARPRVVVIGNQKGGSGKSTFAMHIITGLLKVGKRVASFDLDSIQLTLTRYISNRRKWCYEHRVSLELPEHYAVTDESDDEAPEWKTAVRAKRFVPHLKKMVQRCDHDFIVIDTPSGRQHLNLLREGVADTLLTPINDSLIDLDVLGFRLIKSTIQERRRGRQRPDNFAPACHSELRCA